MSAAEDTPDVEPAGELEALVGDFVRRLQAGEWPDPNEIILAHPHLADKLEEALGAALSIEQPRYATAVDAGEFGTAAVWGGEGLDLVCDVAPARTIVERLVREAEEARARLG